MELVVFEENKPLIVHALGKGDFDYIEAASEVFETDFFRFIKATTMLDTLAETYPTPRKKEDVIPGPLGHDQIRNAVLVEIAPEKVPPAY